MDKGKLTTSAIRLARSGFRLPIENDGNRWGGFFGDHGHEEPLAVGRDEILEAWKNLQGTAQMSGKQRHGSAGFNGVTVGSNSDRNGHELSIERDVK